MKPTYCAFNKTAESFLGLNICCADTTWSRFNSWLGTYSLAHGDGLWVAPARGLFAINMVVPVDLIYLDSKGQVVWLVEHLTGFRFGRVRLRGASVLKLPTHAIYESHTQVGDQLVVSAVDEMESYLKQSNAAANGKNR